MEVLGYWDVFFALGGGGGGSVICALLGGRARVFFSRGFNQSLKYMLALTQSNRSLCLTPHPSFRRIRGSKAGSLPKLHPPPDPPHSPGPGPRPVPGSGSPLLQGELRGPLVSGLSLSSFFSYIYIFLFFSNKFQYFRSDGPFPRSEFAQKFKCPEQLNQIISMPQ